MALPVGRVIGHREWAPGRKSDPTYNMNWRRDRVAAFRPGEEDDMPSAQEIADAILDTPIPKGDMDGTIHPTQKVTLRVLLQWMDYNFNVATPRSVWNHPEAVSVDPQAVAEALAAALPADLARQVAENLAQRLKE